MNARLEAVTRTVDWVKGHGTENDFLVVFDPDGQAYDWIDADVVRAICHRRRGVGADGLLRAVRTARIADGAPYGREAEWFMDFRNADGSVGEMCGNGVRVFTRFLLTEGLAGPGEVPIATRAGIKRVRPTSPELLTADMGVVSFPATGEVKIVANGRSWPGTAVDVGNPHCVAYVDDLSEPGALLTAPAWEPVDAFPVGVNVEFVVRTGERQVAMRVHERGVGETRSCGTGACAVAATTARLDGATAPWEYTVDVPGGTLLIAARADGHIEMTGPATLTARGTFHA